jgi:opacity protein-like surface antigen
MTVNFKSLLAGLVLLGAASGPALAGGDYYQGSAKDYAGVPVPAPIPVPLYDPVWYFRIDASLGLAGAPAASESGLVFGEGNNNYRAADLFGTDESWIENNFEQEFSFGFGIGYRWNSWLRTDVTAETMREQNVTMFGHGTEDLLDVSGPGGPLAIPGTYDATTEDDTKLRGGVVMFNAYYDFNRMGGFTPYSSLG